MVAFPFSIFLPSKRKTRGCQTPLAGTKYDLLIEKNFI
jgi:hypothetical protein